MQSCELCRPGLHASHSNAAAAASAETVIDDFGRHHQSDQDPHHHLDEELFEFSGGGDKNRPNNNNNNRVPSIEQQQNVPFVDSIAAATATDEPFLSSASGINSATINGNNNNHIRNQNEDEEAPNTNMNTQSSGSGTGPNSASKLRIVRLLAPDGVQNGTQNVTIDCAFKFDKKLDQRLTIKWFFNDELEPIYQWIPELNKRVFSDRYEQFLDKSYEVSQDVDFMLQAYKWLQLSSPSNSPVADPLPATSNAQDINNNLDRERETEATTGEQPSDYHHHQHQHHHHQQQQQQPNDHDDELLASSRRQQLANRLNKLAKLGGKHSRQLLDSLRLALEMEPNWLEYTRFRALRLIRPTTQLNGRFTCSVSSLEGEDLKSKQLVVYEPAKSFTFTVSRVPNSPNQFNLTCQASQVFPRPSLTLFRYRAGPPSLTTNQALISSSPDQKRRQSHHQQQQQLIIQQRQQQQQQSTGQGHRPKLAATSLRQEPIADTRTHLTLSYQIQKLGINTSKSPSSRIELDANGSGEMSAVTNDINHFEGASMEDGDADATAATIRPSFYDISSWALVDEASLSSYVVTQFECLLTIEGLDQSGSREPQMQLQPQQQQALQQQRLSLALQKGWHVNSASLTSRSTLVGLFSALASLLCLMLAMVSSMLIFKLLKRHAKNRIHNQDKTSNTTSTDDAVVSVPASVAAAAAVSSGSSRSSR